jgi:hypothetical protein
MDVRKAIDKLADSETPEGSILAALRANFPDHYYGIARRVSELPSSKNAAAAALGRQTMQSLISANKMNIVAAPTAKLNEYVRAYANLMNVLQAENVTVCARMAMGDRSPSGPLPPRVNAATAKFAIASMQAAKAGIDSPQARNLSAVSAPDSQELAAKLATQSLDNETMNLLVADNLKSGTTAQQCAGGTAAINAIAAMSPEASARMTAMLLVL